MRRRRLQSPSPPLPRAQRGVAVVTALLLTTLAVTIVASLFWQQQVQVRSMENQRLQLQTKWILRGALDWACLILREDKKFSTVDHLGEPWAVKLAETRLDDYIEKGHADSDTTDATLSGNITDAQGRYNLHNVSSNGEIDTEQREVLRRLLVNLKLDPQLADPIVAFIAASDRPAGSAARDSAGGVPMRIGQVDDLLAVPGVTPEVRDALRDYVVFLPGTYTRLNVNTASAEVLSAVVASLSLADAQALLVQRERAYFLSTNDFRTRLNGKAMPPNDALDVATSFFLVFGRVKLDRASLQTTALLQRDANRTFVVWVREN